MPPKYTPIEVTRELPVTPTYPKPGQRVYDLKAPGVVTWDAAGWPVKFCMADVVIWQRRGSKLDAEQYLIEQATEQECRNAPRDQYGRPCLSGYVFHCTSATPTPERPGIYLVACGVDGLPYWCGCLGARGYQQNSSCKHKSVLFDLATKPL